MHGHAVGQAGALEPVLGGVGVHLLDLDRVHMPAGRQLAGHPDAAVAEERADLEHARGAGCAHEQREQAARLGTDLDRGTALLDVRAHLAQQVVLRPVVLRQVLLECVHAREASAGAARRAA